ncbi:hypothetical protein [Robertmurraya andreesenii]|uniref:Uncharacterized protein n=1 Tax=Anoxybacillus andreesenii TaxID=1325932 RepID=A0ABT9V9A8_9BACL|nr:hypothetical protein [Robertmurraya andreesenii]MDQ0157519.1 hypothetical protein [Robertmurraya andreesenii]
MKRLMIIVASIGIILLLSAFTLGQNFPRSYHQLITSTTNLSEEDID